MRHSRLVEENAERLSIPLSVSASVCAPKICSGVPELGPLPNEYFARNKRNATGLQTYSRKFQGLYQKYLRQGYKDAFELAREETLKHFASLGFKELDSQRI